MNLIVAPHNGNPAQTGDHGTVGHPPTPARHCQLRSKPAVVFAGVGCRARTIQSTSDPLDFSSFNH